MEVQLRSEDSLFSSTRMVLFVVAVLAGSSAAVALPLIPRLINNYTHTNMWVALGVLACLASCVVVYLAVQCCLKRKRGDPPIADAGSIYNDDARENLIVNT